jgi:hypothetical protein
VAATHPAATTASVASMLCCPSLVEWMSRTPVAQRSKRSIVPASATTWTPDAAMAAVTASETSWSSLIKMRGAISTR